MTITLKYPIEVRGERFGALTMRAPTIGDQVDLPHIDPAQPARKLGEEERVGLLMANLCGVPPSIIQELDWVDYDAVKDAFNKCSAPGQEAPPLRRPKAGDFWAADEGARDNAAREFRLIARCAGLTPGELKATAMSRYRAWQEQLVGFKRPQPKTSGDSYSTSPTSPAGACSI